MSTTTDPDWNAEYDKFRAWLNETIGISETFHEGLRDDDDWTFIIKLHAMIEAGLNHLLNHHFDNPLLAATFARLETSDKRTGKIAFVQACDLLPQPCVRFIRALSEVRNLLVHDVRNFGFDLSAHETGMDSNQRRVWREAITGSLPPTVEHEGAPFPTKDATARYLIFSSTFFIMASILQRQLIGQRDRKILDSLRHVGTLAFEHFGHAAPAPTIATR
jgi:hypothetical protein